MSLPDQVRELLKARTFGHLALVDERGRPHVSPVWLDVEDDLVAVNTAEGRVKARLLQVGAVAAISILDPGSAYRYVMIRGEVVSRTHEGALDEIDRLSRKYARRPWAAREGEQRVSVRIRPDTVSTHL